VRKSFNGGVLMASVTLKNMYKVYDGGVTAVSDFSLDIEDKEFIVLVGPSGCGKSTTLRMVAGLEEITEGELYIGDKLMNDVAPKDRDIAMVFQNYALYPHMTVYDNMAFGLKLRKTPKAEIDRRVKEAARILDIEHLLNRKPKALSGGQRQRVALGRAIVREPKVFLMDEPLSNLDAKLRVQMRTEITKLHNRLQTTFIYVTHDQTEAMTMGTRIVVMKDGFIQQVDTPQNLYDHPVNLFVGGFIGSPQMNFINVTLTQENNAVYAVFEDGESKIKIPEGKIKKFVDPSYIGKEVIMGIRPEDFHDEEIFMQSADETIIKAFVEVVELMGSETYLYLNIGGYNVTARVDPRSTARANDTIRIAIDSNRLHFFDKETEESLLVR
jgi:multiple sugar transport system ATP-binding protein